MQTREESNNITSSFSNTLELSYKWFDDNFTDALAKTFSEFWGLDVKVKLLSISENSNLICERDEFFVTQIRLNTELSVFIRLSKKIVKSTLEKILGKNGKTFDISKITDLEAKILTGFDEFLYQNIENLIKSKENLPENNRNYNECNLTFFLQSENQTLGKIVIKIPVVAVEPAILEHDKDSFTIADFTNGFAKVNLTAGYTKMRLNELKQLETGDIVLLEQSNSSVMLLTYNDFQTQIKVAPNPAIMIDYNNFDNNGETPKGDDNMPNSDIYNMWDTIQVDIGAEFEKVKLSLGELKQISEGLVIDIGSVYDNKIELKVEDKIVASGELVIINDRYGVKINKIFTEQKNQASQNAQDSQNEGSENLEENYEMPAADEIAQDSDMLANDESEQGKEEDFDYSDFDVDEDDL